MSLAETTDGEWKTHRQKTLEGIEDLALTLPPDGAREFDENDIMRFLEQAAEGYGPMEIGLSMGWSPAMVNRFIGDPERAELLAMITDSQHESVERAIRQHAIGGNSTAMKLYAFNRMSHRGWADRSEIRINHQGQQELVVTVRAAMQEQTRKAIEAGGIEGVVVMQALGELTPDAGADDDIVDGEIVDD